MIELVRAEMELVRALIELVRGYHGSGLGIVEFIMNSSDKSLASDTAPAMRPALLVEPRLQREMGC